MTSLDFNAGLDFTALDPATGGDHNSLIELASPREDKAIVLFSTDTALDTPDVPDASIDTKWKRYLWNRQPHSTSDDTSPIIYAWDDNAASDILFLQWVPIAPGTAEFEALVADALAEAQTATATANTALTTANAANLTAATALSNANDAVVTANAVSDDATNALAAATDAQSVALSAQATATEALAVANAANATAAAALAQLAISRANKYVCIVEQQDTGDHAGDSVVGANVRQLNLEKNDAGNLATVAAGIVTVLAGIYRVRAWAVGFSQGTGHQLFLVKDDDDTTLMIGRTVYQDSVDVNLPSELSGVITFAATTAIRLDHYCSHNQTNGLGKAITLGPVADTKEIYALLELEKLN